MQFGEQSKEMDLRTYSECCPGEEALGPQALYTDPCSSSPGPGDFRAWNQGAPLSPTSHPIRPRKGERSFRYNVPGETLMETCAKFSKTACSLPGATAMSP